MLFLCLKKRWGTTQKKQLEVTFFQVLVDGARVVGQPALSTAWISIDQERNIHPLWKNGANYSSQRSFTYIHGRPLWITSKSENAAPLKELDVADMTIDTWGVNTDGSDFEDLRADLPKYQDYGDGVSKTSVIVPLRFGDRNPRVFGTINLEFNDRLEMDRQNTARIGTLVNAISRVFWLHETTRAQNLGTTDAARALRQRLDDEAVPGGFRKPALFFAYSSKADRAVCDEIISVVRQEFGEFIRLYSWEEDNQSGAIDRHLVEQITSSSFAICYFSEPTRRNSGKYCDNPNVLIEAGMLHATYGIGDLDTRRWLPIREKPELTTPIPFDFVSQRFLSVPRSPNGKLVKKDFAERLKDRIAAMLNA